MIHHTEFGRIWTTPSRYEKKHISKNCYSLFIRNNRKFPYEILTFLLCKLYHFFLFHILVTLVIILTEFGWFWTTPWTDEKDLFFKIRKNLQNFAICEILQIPYEKPTLFLGKLCQKFFFPHTLITLVMLHTEFGLIWTTPWPHEKELFLKFVIRLIRKIPNEIQLFF